MGSALSRESSALANRTNRAKGTKRYTLRMDSDLPDAADLRRRVLSLHPFTYGHVWLWAVIGVGLPVLALVSALGFISAWSHPWPQLAAEMPVSAVVLNGTARSIWLRRLPRNVRGA
jgi:hypothetical protein